MKTSIPAQHGKSAGTVTTIYKKGDLAWYRQRDGTFVPAKVVSVDLTVQPPSYAVDLGGSVRETEAPRLRPRVLGEAAPPPAVPPGGNPFGVHAPLAPPQKDFASCGPPAAVSVHASSGNGPVPVSVPVAARSADSWPSAGAGYADSTWHAAGAEAAAEEDEDFGDFCDADVSAASMGSSGAAVALPNGALLDQQSAWFSAQPPVADIQRGSGATGTIIANGIPHLPAPAALPQVHAAAGSRTQVPLSFASFDAFRPSASARSFAGEAGPNSAVYGAAASSRTSLPSAAASSFIHAPSRPAALPTESSLHQMGPTVAANNGADFGDFEAASWQPYTAPSAACTASGPADSHLNSKLEEAARKAEAGANGGGRGVTPASTIDIAREELDFSEASDEDDFGDFEDAASGDLPADPPAAAGAPALDRSAPLPMSLFGEETDPAEASPPLPSLDLAAPWGGFGFDQALPDQAPPAERLFTPVPVLALPSQAPDQAHPSTKAPTLAPPSHPGLFPACAPATPLPLEHTPCALNVSPLSAPGPVAQRQERLPSGAGALEAVPNEAGEAYPGMSGEAAVDSAEPDAFSERAAPSEPGMLDAQISLDARKDMGEDMAADAQRAVQTSLVEPEVASSSNTAAVTATAVAEGEDQGSGLGINWDALDFSFADDVPDQAPQTQHSLDAPAACTESAQVAGLIENAADDLSVPSGAATQEKTAEQRAAISGAAVLESLRAESEQPAEHQMAADDEEVEEWGDFEEFPAAESSTDASAGSAGASHQEHTWFGEPTASSSATTERPAESVTMPGHAHELAQSPVLAAPGPSLGVPCSSAAPDEDLQSCAAVTWPAESAGEASSAAELALSPDLTLLQPSTGAPSSHLAATDWDLLDGGVSGSVPTAGPEITSPSQVQDAEAAGWGWDAEDSWLAADAEMRPALPSADVWNTLASCDPGVPAPEPRRRVGSVPQGDDLFDEGLWGEDWAAAASSGAGSPDLQIPAQPPAAAVSGTFAGHDRATALRLLAKAAEAELAEGERIWSEACSGGCQASFCAGAVERQYIMALGAIYFVVAALRGGCTIGGVDDAATAGSLMRCQECWHGQTQGMPALRTAYEAAAAEAELSQLSLALAEACTVLEALTGLEEEGSCRTGPSCAITCLPLALCPAVPAVQFEGGSSWAPVANLWANRVQPGLQAAHQL